MYQIADLELTTKCELGDDVIKEINRLRKANHNIELEKLLVDQISQLTEYKNKLMNNK
jgi:hypothetical protein